jgi:hypothetical protein
LTATPVPERKSMVYVHVPVRSGDRCARHFWPLVADDSAALPSAAK